MSTRAGPRPARTHSVKELLSRSTPVLTRVTDQAADHAARAEFWKGWFCRHLPTELAGRVSGVVERDDTLTVFASSAVWSARLRYVLRELEPQIRATAPSLNTVSVRVHPQE